MFNLLIAYGGWTPKRNGIGRGRVLEYTADDLKTRFMPNNELDVEAVLRLPTLFAAETGTSEELVHVGLLSRVRMDGNDVELSYTYDPDIPPITNERFLELMSELDIDKWELSRTHWAIKDVDLFRVLLKSASTVLEPKVFNLNLDSVERDLVSVMIPFDASFDRVYEDLRAAIEAMGLRCQRADDIWRHDVIIQNIVSLICSSKTVICDLSRKNANVFYEAGIAHTLGKNVILITQSPDDVPFDLRHLWYVRYLDNGEGRADLVKQVTQRLQSL